jgi:hypothetical protein
MTAPTADGPPIGDDDPIGVRHDRVAELDLDPDDRPETGLLEGRRRPDDPVETLVIGDREAAQPELGRPLGQLVRGRCAIEEREVGMAVELGVGGHRRTRNDRTFVRFDVGDSTIPGPLARRPAAIRVLPGNDPKSPRLARNKTPTSGVYRRMKRVNPSLVIATLRIAFAVAIALVLILVLLPAMLAAQAAGLR